ncbi:MAG: hypothetical protein HY690_13995 [Chloroflexi bacterium]|nr:hypothetical protein [Chloroflexota bacterium]
MGRLRGIARQPGVVLCGLSLVLIGLVATPVSASTSTPAEVPSDYAIPGGRFYTQTGGGKGGFGVRDLAGVRFWSEYVRYGGPEALGYPLSRPFWGPGGFLYQAFQRGLLQWRPEAEQALLANNLEIIEAHNPAHNQWLFASYSIPYPRRPKPGSFEDEAAERLSWLTNEAIRDAFLTDPATGEPWDEEAAVRFYGLPQSEPRRAGPFIVQRFQRIPLQLWVDQVPGMPAPGAVVGVLSGELVRECGAVPRDATIPEPPVPPAEGSRQ